MTYDPCRLPIQEADAAVAALCAQLENPPPAGGSDDGGPDRTRWRHQSLSKGAAGIAVLHAVRAQTGDGPPQRVRDWLRRAVSEDVIAGSGAGLWFGAPAVAFAFAASRPGHDRPARSALDSAVTGLTRLRLDTARDRIAAGGRPAVSEYDLVRGLTGLGAHLLAHQPEDALVPQVLDYLVQLTVPVSAADGAGSAVPGWWTSGTPGKSHPDGPEDGGHSDQGMAHGIAGPLALLSLALRRGITVPGQADAIDRICRWLDTWQQQSPAGPWWPARLTLADLRAGHPGQATPDRPSWCYGTPGLARAQQLAGLARADTARQQAAENALARCLNDPQQLGRLRDSSLCHGWAGLAATTWYAAADAITPALGAHLPGLMRTLITHATPADPAGPPGLIDGRAGLALILHTLTRPAPSTWPACLLIA